jgi:hypothetical protein
MNFAIGIVVAVGLLALLMRVFGGGRPAEPDGRPADQAPEPGAESTSWSAGAGQELDELGAEPGDVVAITSDGVAFVPDGDQIHLVPPGIPEDVFPVRAANTTTTEPSTDPDTAVLLGRGAPVNPRTGRRLPGWEPGQRLEPGDLIAVRIVRGAPDHDPWRLEALGRDHDYQAWAFETEESARAAHDLLQHHIVRPPRDEDGEVVVPGSADFAEAIRREEETAAELAAADLGGEDDPRDEPGRRPIE